jgi:hypothetical protein
MKHRLNPLLSFLLALASLVAVLPSPSQASLPLQWSASEQSVPRTSGEISHTPCTHASFVQALEFSPDGRYLLSASDDRTARLWDVATGETVRVLGGHGHVVTDVAFLDGSVITTPASTMWRSGRGPRPGYSSRPPAAARRHPRMAHWCYHQLDSTRRFRCGVRQPAGHHQRYGYHPHMILSPMARYTVSEDGTVRL